jgi:replicative DNA helicase
VPELLEQLQLAALYHASTTSSNAETVFSITDVDDYEPGAQQETARVIRRLLAEGDVTQMAVASELSRLKPELMKWFIVHVKEEFYGTPTYCANHVRDAANRRRLEATLTRALQAANSARSVEEIMGSLMGELAQAEAHITSGLGVLDFDTVLHAPDDLRPWIMPQMLRTNERMIITGPEGGGKSVLVAQICLGASMGVNTMSAGFDSHEPLRVLMLDVENDRLQVRNNMRKVYPHLRGIRDVQPLIEWVDVQNVDLSDPVEQQKVIRLAKERKPQLMYMGSLYRLAPEGDKVDSAFTYVSRTVDKIRAETGASVLLEAHAGHGMQNDRNGMRPYGSSMWMRWPEFGFGMVRHRATGHIELKNWRGHRSDDRLWPAALRRGSVLPWQPIMPDEWEVVAGITD